MTKRAIIFAVSVIIALTFIFVWLSRQRRQQTSGESIVLHAVARAIHTFAENNERARPVSWRQMAKYIDLDDLNGRYLLKHQSPVQASYVFITNNLFPPEKWTGSVILIRRSPVTNKEGRSGRFYISWPYTDVHWLPETKVAAILKEAQMELPNVDQEEALRAVEIFRKGVH